MGPPGYGFSHAFPTLLRLAEIGMPVGLDCGAELLERTCRSGRTEHGQIGKRPGDRIAKLEERAAEQLARRLELGTEPEKPELVVAGDIHPGTQLVQEQKEPGARLFGEGREPRRYPAR